MNELFTPKDPATRFEINNKLVSAGQMTKEQVIALINKNSNYSKYFHVPESKKKRITKNKES